MAHEGFPGDPLCWNII